MAGVFGIWWRKGERGGGLLQAGRQAEVWGDVKGVRDFGQEVEDLPVGTVPRGPPRKEVLRYISRSTLWLRAYLAKSLAQRWLRR